MLHRSTALTVITLLGGALLTAAPATAVGETCQGRPATIVGTGPEVAGTPGNDVIVSGRSTVILADAGDDLICVTHLEDGTFVSNVQAHVTVDAGPGDDVVDTTATVSRTRAMLGTGVDRYLGGPGGDSVEADGADDEVLGGDGADHTTLRIASAPGAVLGRYDGGPGANGITVQSPTSALDVTLDGRVLVDGVAAADNTGFHYGNVAAFRAILRGTGNDDYLTVQGCDLKVYGGAGDDRLVRSGLGYPGMPQCEDKLRSFGGAGDDTLFASTDDDRLSGNAGKDVLTGDGDPDVLLGGPGSDRLTGGLGSDLMRGHGGADILKGDHGHDKIFGGRGRDKAFGDEDKDLCVAEVERDCEK